MTVDWDASDGNLSRLWARAAEPLVAEIEANPEQAWAARFVFGSLCAAPGTRREWSRPFIERVQAVS